MFMYIGKIFAPLRSFAKFRSIFSHDEGSYVDLHGKIIIDTVYAYVWTIQKVMMNKISLYF